MSGNNRTPTKSELDFIKDKELKRTVEDSIQYLSLIFDNAEKSNSNLYKEETYRVIILYVISIIEAILLYVLKKRDQKITHIQYKYVSSVEGSFMHSKLPESPVVIAVQKEVVKDERKIGLVDLVTFMEKKKLMSPDSALKILNINDIRNTFHFTKPRDKITCEIKTVENALELLVNIIKRAPKVIIYTKK